MIDQSLILEQLLAGLPEDKAQEVIDFAAYLRQQYAPHPQRGSAEAILDALSEGVVLEFDAGELDALLDELEAMRASDMTDHG